MFQASQGALVVKNPPASAGDRRNSDLIPGSRGCLEGGHGNPLQYSCVENPHGQRSLAGYSPYGCKELAMTEHSTEHLLEAAGLPSFEDFIPKFYIIFTSSLIYIIYLFCQQIEYPLLCVKHQMSKRA